MSEEYIKKSDAIAGFESWKSGKNSAGENFFLCGAQDVIQSIPAADVEPVVRAHWVEHIINEGGRLKERYYECSNCHTERNFARYLKFCPDCGAHMDERSEQG